jgi:hypothetical protein
MLLAMENSLIKSRERFRELILDFLWRQWGALGVAGSARGNDAWIIDPEALLLATTTFGRCDPRLFDEVIDWLNTNSQAINLQRLQNLGRHLGQRSVLNGLAEHLAQRATNTKWRSFLREAKPVTVGELLFPGVPISGETDELFARHGWQRGPLKLRQLSRSPDPNYSTNLLLKLRSLFGVQARAEVMAYLLAFESGHPAEMSERLAYFPRTVQTTLNDMERSGHVLAGRQGREKRFWLRREEWRFLITWHVPEGEFPHWIDWAPRFAALETVWQFLNKPELESSTPGVQAIELRASLEKMSPAFLRENIQASPGASGAEFVMSVLGSFKKLLE